jgi:hypothetical protein
MNTGKSADFWKVILEKGGQEKLDAMKQTFYLGIAYL